MQLANWAAPAQKTKSILLTQHEEEQYIHEALEAGVKGIRF